MQSIRFEVDERVVHPQHGLGRVVKLEHRQLGEGTPRLYYEVAISNGTIWVPVEGPTSGLRRLTTKRDLDQYRGVLKSRPAPLSADHRQRQHELTDRLRNGSLQARCEVVRDLTALGWHKPLGEGSATLLRNTHERLDQEWAVAEGLSLSDATLEIHALLLEGKARYSK